MPQNRYPEPWRLVAGLLGLTAVLLGAIAAHAIKDPQASAAVERAANYQLIHAVVLFAATFASGRMATLAKWALLAGMLMFCGGIYAKYLFLFPKAGNIAPLGGVTLMLGWLFLGLTATQRGAPDTR